eukprot:Hpha_TRINITY_DN15007_c0_g3::TRINITY_DN15007_c0_g3_i1::g.124128::m.124128/K10755/RFC2_4; replication factor C subunit 2/4
MPAAAVPWVEKYRPRTVHDVVHQPEVCAMLKSQLESDKPNLPHLLFHGPPGTGKTSTILAACRQLYGPQYMGTRVKELNASDDRGIDVIRKKVKTFAQAAVGASPQQMQDGTFYPVPPYKIIILDEADALSAEAQGCLRRVIEDWSSVTRFCIICNYSSRIIEALVSRCAKFRFAPIAKDQLQARLRKVSEAEGLSVEDSGLQRLVDVSGGDLRQAIQLLQGAQKAYGDDLRGADWAGLAGKVPKDLLEDFFRSWWADFGTMQRAASVIVSQGFSATQLVSQLVNLVVEEDTSSLNDVAKANILVKCSNTSKPLFDGASELLTILDLGGYAVSVISGVA